MEPRIYHGTINPRIISQALMAEFNTGNFRAQTLGQDDNITIQIATDQMRKSGGHTAVSVHLQKVEDGVMVQIGEQQWYGVAASLGQTALSALLNPLNLLGRLDDIAQDVQSLQITERVLAVIETVARKEGAGKALSDRFARLTCTYCGVANRVGEPACIACGAPLGKEQLRTCSYCGYVLKQSENNCPNCGRIVR
mgnify:CR=1 FL=1